MTTDNPTMSRDRLARLAVIDVIDNRLARLAVIDSIDKQIEEEALRYIVYSLY